jgi:hypothetical protein
MLLTEELITKIKGFNYVICVVIDRNYQDNYCLHISVIVTNMDNNNNILNKISLLLQTYENQLRLTNDSKWCVDLRFLYN